MSAKQPESYLTIVYRITHPRPGRDLLEHGERLAYSHTHAIHDLDQMRSERDDLLEALKAITDAADEKRVTAEHYEVARAAIAKAIG